MLSFQVTLGIIAVSGFEQGWAQRSPSKCLQPSPSHLPYRSSSLEFSLHLILFTCKLLK
ncbi:hypothetical protein DsansV1_C23g0175051 [Dioscorea sansibarensis]